MIRVACSERLVGCLLGRGLCPFHHFLIVNLNHLLTAHRGETAWQRMAATIWGNSEEIDIDSLWIIVARCGTLWSFLPFLSGSYHSDHAFTSSKHVIYCHDSFCATQHLFVQREQSRWLGQVFGAIFGEVVQVYGTSRSYPELRPRLDMFDPGFLWFLVIHEL